jgi:hypothetical protein
MDRKEIVDYLAKKVFNGELTRYKYYVMLKNKQIYEVSDYGLLVDTKKISPEDAFVYIDSRNYSYCRRHKRLVMYLFPLIDPDSSHGIVSGYLGKLGFYNPGMNYPATGLKYYAVVRLFLDRLVIELTDIDIMATNTGLRKIVIDVLGKDILTQREISWDQKEEINDKLYRQKLFAGNNWGKAYKIIERYYIYHKTSLAKEVLAITDAYNRIFEPYRVVYDTKTRQQVLM